MFCVKEYEFYAHLIHSIIEGIFSLRSIREKGDQIRKISHFPKIIEIAIHT